jgi:hypothetical protein
VTGGRIRSDPQQWDLGILCLKCGHAIAGHPLEGLVSDIGDPRELCAGCFACTVENKHGPWCRCVPRGQVPQ